MRTVFSFKNFFYVFLCVFSANAIGELKTQSFLFYPKDASSYPVNTSLEINDTGEKQIGIVFPYFRQAFTIASYCTADRLEIPIRGNTRWWLLAPKGKIKDPRGIIYEVLNSNWELPNSIVDKVPGYETYVSPIEHGIWNNPQYPNHLCWDIGSVQGGFDGGVAKWTALIRVDRATAIPGKYKLSIPIRLGWEENKGYAHGTSAGWTKFPTILFQQNPININVDLTVTSKCSFNTSPINLSHGTMTGRNADGNQTKPYNLNVTCTPGTSLSVKLLGTQKVSGKTNNYTKCGAGGMCELTFDNGKYDETMTVDNSKTLSIKSTYRLNNVTKPVAESFEGSGVLQVLVN
ncbi:spore coat protein U domain-containing protein [Escherichia coli]|uniref:spore coat protein U domain-containing protein n=1 Tax=Escherichia coli TaxID=562 RepID=UPI003C7447BF